MKRNQNPGAKGDPPTIRRVAVGGYKSIGRECKIELRPLTVLAGANSSGKSSIFQPLLLLKQTLEASYDPGVLNLMGDHVRFSSGEQLLSKSLTRASANRFYVKMDMTDGDSWACHYAWTREKGFEVVKLAYTKADKSFDVTPGSTDLDAGDLVPDFFTGSSHQQGKFRWSSVRDRCFAALRGQRPESVTPVFQFPLAANLAGAIRGIIHLPGLRGNPERVYPMTAVGSFFQGTFPAYTASVLAFWKDSGEIAKIEAVGQELMELGLTWKVVAVRQNDAQVEILVGRLPRPAREGSMDVVSIADVGLGVSQVLPVLVALRAAQPGQIVILEEPETHLHPRAQMAMAKILTDAANRGVVVVVETHSSILLRGIQTAIAEGALSSDKVGLNWFKRDERTGETECRAGELDSAGTFGDWPEDFDDTNLESERRFMDANEKSLS